MRDRWFLLGLSLTSEAHPWQHDFVSLKSSSPARACRAQASAEPCPDARARAPDIGGFTRVA